MSEERRKQIASSVVLAVHGNKNACKDVYVYYHKNIFFISRMFTSDVAEAMDLTAEIFIKMFEKLDKLEDHTVFEQWFYSYAVNMCRKRNAVSTVDPSAFGKLLEIAVENAKNHDKEKFNRNITDILKAVFAGMPCESKVMMLYKYFAGLDEEKTALIERISEEEAVIKTQEAEDYLEQQAEILSQSGISIIPFLEDLENTLYYIAAKSVVFDSVHKKVSEALGIDVNPYVVPEKPKQEEKTAPEKENKKSEKKKSFFTKKDLIFFGIVLVIAIIIFSVVESFYNSKNEGEKETVSVSQQQRPVVVWNGAAAMDFESGSGTQEDPFIIVNGGQLAHLANLVNNGNSFYAACHYKLDNDIVLNDTSDWENWIENAPENKWTPIGYESESGMSSYFTGTFDGAGFTISGMYVSQQEHYAGLFGIVRNGHIRNLCVKESVVLGDSYVGGIAGYFFADSTDIPGFDSCSFLGNVVAEANNAGGITGYFSADGDQNIIVITDCCSFGSVSAGNGFAGGICGVNEAVSGNARVTNSFNAAEVSAVRNAGGIVGNIRCKDGIAYVENCYNAGKISAESNGGSVAGLLSKVDGQGKASVMNCFAKTGTADVIVSVAEEDEKLIDKNNTLLTEEEMKQQVSYKDFNFDDIWQMGTADGYDYPVLRKTVIGTVVLSEDESL